MNVQREFTDSQQSIRLIAIYAKLAQQYLTMMAAG